MFKGMSLSVGKLRLDKCEPHRAASAACRCFFEWWYQTPIGSNGDLIIADCSNFIFARPLIIRKRSMDYVLMHFDMIDNAFTGTNPDTVLDAFIVESEICDSKIEVISWLYTVDFYEEVYNNDEEAEDIIMDYLSQYSVSFLKKLKKQRPNSKLLKLALKSKLAS